MRIIVAGPRDFTDAKFVRAKLDRLTAALDDAVILTGACPTGVDAIAEQWAFFNGYTVERYHADWDRHKKAAGPLRNSEMVGNGGAKALIAFLDAGRGDVEVNELVALAKKHRLRVRIVQCETKSNG